MGMKKGALAAVLCAVLLTTACGGGDKGADKKAEEDAGAKKKNLVITTEEEGSGEQDDAGAGQAQDPPAQDIQAQVEGLASGLAGGGEWAVYVYGLDTGREASVNNKPMQSASLIKLFIAGTVYEQKDRMDAQNGAQETETLLRSMITVSDNDAANTLVKRLGNGDAAAGMQAVNDFAAAHGYTQTHMRRLMLDFDAEDDNYTSVKDCGAILQDLYRHELAGAEQITGFMKEQTRTEKIPAGVPAGTVTANKTGELDTVENDAALVWGGQEPYAICAMSQGLTDAAAARTGIQKLSSDVYELMR